MASVSQSKLASLSMQDRQRLAQLLDLCEDSALCYQQAVREADNQFMRRINSNHYESRVALARDLSSLLAHNEVKYHSARTQQLRLDFRQTASTLYASSSSKRQEQLEALDAAFIKCLRALVRHLDNKKIAEFLAAKIANLQMYHDRVQDMHSHSGSW